LSIAAARRINSARAAADSSPWSPFRATTSINSGMTEAQLGQMNQGRAVMLSFVSM
jgi:hypothetical protein